MELNGATSRMNVQVRILESLLPGRSLWCAKSLAVVCSGLGYFWNEIWVGCGLRRSQSLCCSRGPAPQRALWGPLKGLCGRAMFGGQCMEVEGLGFLVLVKEIWEGGAFGNLGSITSA